MELTLRFLAEVLVNNKMPSHTLGDDMGKCFQPKNAWFDVTEAIVRATVAGREISMDGRIEIMEAELQGVLTPK
ncbi:MAG: hypothetical protein COU90_01110 [Candidatus Ryanbacteria bacterium CG10_big_fil_rev_8_21_14_0_10_43_42]|uniref:Uncharacterized protein n=1 Tax=Candidatus Ryanbacteria bacterium CG10_big_fil_rev_8_21_14_0_10_43_42 TaxID=1974864 RepID=A0A2M8KY49_9BACT|nr:MAG: hypothetical protein COU90_01110 [Candidatus Ryanbacteria bacterium CG10_big_fil_rev_8_21_14_0_10_43_42]